MVKMAVMPASDDDSDCAGEYEVTGGDDIDADYEYHECHDDECDDDGTDGGGDDDAE